MAKIVKGVLNYKDEWAWCHVRLFPGNPIRNRHGHLVMGRGAAANLRDAKPGIAKRFGDVVKEHGNYPLLFVQFDGNFFGYFQVKYHYNGKAVPALIKESTTLLADMAVRNPDKVFHLPYPGIGNGGLAEADVSAIVELLPDNVVLYKLEI